MAVISGKAIKKTIRVENVYIRECLSELLGTFLLVTFGIGSVAMYVLPPTLNSFLSVSFGWGIAAAMGVWASAGVSGGHINPAVTLAMAILGRTRFVQVPVYWIGQYLGAFLGAACAYGIYYDALNNFDGGDRSVVGENATAGIFATYPQQYVSIGSGLGDQVFGTMLLVLCVMAISDKKNTAAPAGLAPLCVGFVIFLIGVTFGQNCGFAINPARDLGPRVFTAIAGWGGDVFSAYDYYFWIPIVGPHIGALCGAWIYLIFVGVHIPEQHNNYEADQDTKPDAKMSELNTYITMPVDQNQNQTATSSKPSDSARF